jgi:zinc protease
MKKKIHSNDKQDSANLGERNILYTEHTLSNGLSLILSKDSTIPSAVINLCYHVGSKDEDTDKRGYAHLLEHLMFEGSVNIPDGAYDDLALYHGCENNAYTSEDKTNYYLLLPSHELEFGFWLESDRLLGLSLTDESIETQIGVVIEEKKQMFDNRPYGSVSFEFPPRLFKNSGYAWDTIGDEADILKANISRLKPFYNKYYNPNNAVLSVVGDIDIDKTLKLAEKYFGSIPAGEKPPERVYDEPVFAEPVTTEIFDNIQLPGIFIAYKVPGENTKESYELDILSDILSMGDSSRLYNEIVYEKQLASEIGAWIDTKEFAGIFYIYAILMPGIKIEQVQREIDRIIDEVKSGKLKENELQKIKNRIETRTTYRKQTILSKADMLAHYKTFFNDPELINTMIGNYRDVALSRIRDTANKFLVDSNRVILNYLPKK